MGSLVTLLMLGLLVAVHTGHVTAYCSGLSQPTNGDVRYSGTSSGNSGYPATTIATFTCNTGYEIIGTPVSWCGYDNTWSSEAPTCSMIDCGTLGSPVNGAKVTETGTTYGSTTSFTCNVGYDMIGSASVNCQADGSWSDGTPTCNIKDCGAVTTPIGGIISSTTGTSFQKYITFSCSAGLTLTGSMTIVCQYDGSWSNIAPTCVIKNCGTLATPTNGQLSLSSGTTFGSVATFSCNAGYELSGKATMNCDTTGSWDGTAPTCTIVDCGALSDPTNGGQTTPTTTYQSSAVFSCDSGYTLTGSASSVCQADGMWNNPVPTCVIKDCGALSTPTNGAMINPGGQTTYLTTVTFTCNSGFDLFGSAVLRCDADRDWNTTVPICVIKDCLEPSPINNGNIDTTGGTTYSSVATYTCNTGYTLIGANQRTCQADGTWSSTNPTCQIVDCGTLSTPAFGNLTLPGGTTYLSVAFFQCDLGYALVGDNIRSCQDDFTWSGATPNCQISDCGTLTSPTNGTVTTQDGTTYKEVATYTCDTGFILFGASQRTCQANAHWSSVNPTCSINDCGNLAVPTNGQVDLSSGTVYQSVATFTCIAGYDLTGVTTLTCQADGTWETPSPTCVIKDCGPLNHPGDGFVDTRSGTTYQSVATYTCILGYEVQGDVTRTCTSAGTWDGTESTCARKDCGSPTSPANGTVMTLDGTTYEGVATYTCDTGFILLGNSSRTCQANADWSGVSPTCRINGAVADCGILNHPEDGLVDTGSGTTYQSVATYICIPGYEVKGDVTRTCTANGTWGGTEPTCARKDCGPLGAPINGFVTPTGGTKYQDVALYSCDPGFTLTGTYMRVCQEDSSWNGTAPTCVIIDCDGLSAPDDGSIDVSGGIAVGDTVRYSCDAGLKLYGDEVRTCLSSGEWSGVPATCLQEQQPVTTCKAVVDDKKTTWSETLPNQVRIEMCPTGFTGSAMRKCNDIGSWEKPVYKCEREEVRNVKLKASALTKSSSKADVQDVLQKLVNVTINTNAVDVESDVRLTLVELEAVSTSFQDIADSFTEDKLDGAVENDFFEAASQMVDSPNKETWKTLRELGSMAAERVIKSVDTATDILLAQFESSNNASKGIVKKNIVVEFKKIGEEDVIFPDIYGRQESWLDITTRAFLSNSAIQGTDIVIMGVIYRDMSEIMTVQQSSANAVPKEINSPVVSIKLGQSQCRLIPPIQLAFQHILTGFSKPSCSFLVNSGTWSTYGCSIASTNSTMTICECDHLTNFAVLMSPFMKVEAESEALRIASIAGICVSGLCIFLTMAVHCYLWRYIRSDRTTLLMHLCVALLLAYTIFLAGVDRTESRIFCAALAALLHYIFLVVFCLMLAEGIAIVILVLFVFATKSRLKLRLTCAWVLPVVIVGISIGVTKMEGYGNENFCWLSMDKGLIWAFVGPALAIILFNLVCLCIIFKVMFSTKAMEQKITIEKVKTGVWSLGVLVPLMGITWIIGIFYINKDFYWMQYVFAICNGLQGVFIFLFHCLLNQQVRNAVAAKKRRQEPTRSTSAQRYQGNFPDMRLNSDTFSSNLNENLPDTGFDLPSQSAMDNL